MLQARASEQEPSSSTAALVRGGQAGGLGVFEGVIDEDDFATDGVEKGGGDRGAHTAATVDPQRAVGVKRLETLSGKPFDRMFLQMMIKHHRGAVTMAETEQEQGVNPEAKELARSIVSSQSAEIARMRRLLKNMGPE